MKALIIEDGSFGRGVFTPENMEMLTKA